MGMANDDMVCLVRKIPDRSGNAKSYNKWTTA
jgi:hypothetical protein